MIVHCEQVPFTQSDVTPVLSMTINGVEKIAVGNIWLHPYATSKSLFLIREGFLSSCRQLVIIIRVFMCVYIPSVSLSSLFRDKARILMMRRLCFVGRDLLWLLWSSLSQAIQLPKWESYLYGAYMYVITHSINEEAAASVPATLLLLGCSHNSTQKQRKTEKAWGRCQVHI